MSALQQDCIFRKDQVIWIKPPQGFESLEFDSETARFVAQHLNSINDGRKEIVIWDLRDIEVKMTVGASRKFATDRAFSKCVSAQAFLLNSLTSRLAINFFIRVHKPICTSMKFNSPDEALLWLHQFKDQ